MTIIDLKFNPEMEKAVIEGRKCCTTRNEPKGETGDIFIVQNRVYRIIKVSMYSKLFMSIFWDIEGFNTPNEFEQYLWNIYPNIPRFGDVCVHFFAYVCEKCPQFGVSGAVCSEPEKLCPIYEECRKTKEADNHHIPTKWGVGDPKLAPDAPYHKREIS